MICIIISSCKKSQKLWQISIDVICSNIVTAVQETLSIAGKIEQVILRNNFYSKEKVLSVDGINVVRVGLNKNRNTIIGE